VYEWLGGYHTTSPWVERLTSPIRGNYLRILTSTPNIAFEL
jgi:hypothetical protein